MPELSPDTILLRYIPATPNYVKLDESGGIDRLELAVFSSEDLKRRDGVSFYVEDLLSEKYPQAESAAAIVAACGSEFAALSYIAKGRNLDERPKYLVVAISVGDIRAHGFKVKLDETDIPVIGHAHALVTPTEKTAKLSRSDLKVTRVDLLSKFELVYGEAGWVLPSPQEIASTT